jgi:hypothetical protein
MAFLKPKERLLRACQYYFEVCVPLQLTISRGAQNERQKRASDEQHRRDFREEIPFLTIPCFFIPFAISRVSQK